MKAFPWALLLLAACAPGAPRTAASPAASAAPEGGLEVAVELDTTSFHPKEGDLAAAVFRLRNATGRVVVLQDLVLLRDFMLPGSSGAVVSWQAAQEGRLTYVPSIDEWEHDRRGRSPTPQPVFNLGLLAPGETVAVRTKIRLLDLPKDFQFSYFELGPEDLLRKVYWEVREGKSTRFRHLVGRDLDARLVKEPREDVASHRRIVFPHAEEVGPSTKLLKSVRVNPAVKPRPFALADAARRAGTDVPARGLYTWCGTLDGWILPHRQGHALVTPAGVGPLPEIRQIERVFFVLDAAYPGKTQVEIAKPSLASALAERKHAVVTQTRSERIAGDVTARDEDYFLFVAPDELARVLADLRDLKAALDVDDAGRLVATR